MAERKNKLERPAAVEIAPANPLCAVLHEISSRHPETVSQSIYEAKASLRVALVSALAETDPTATSRLQAACKKAVKDCEVHRKTTGMKWASQNIDLHRPRASSW